MTAARIRLANGLRATERYRPLRWRVGHRTLGWYLALVLCAAPVVASLLLAAAWTVGSIDLHTFVHSLLGVNEVPGVFILAASLWCTPLSRMTGRNYRRQRKWFGLSFAWCAAMNLLAFLLEHPSRELSEPFAIVGTIAVMLCVPLAMTSTRRMIKRLGIRNWRRLHQLAYVIGVAVVVHLWLVPQDDGPGGNIVATVIFLATGVIRLPPVARRLDDHRRRLGASLFSMQAWLRREPTSARTAGEYPVAST